MTNEKESEKPRFTFQRVVLWLVIAAIGAFLLISGIVGVIVKGQS